ncbi:MAG TPA: hypothetical protein DDW94_09890 [Deltaproteobacteria bacterium]|nr:MAG: hypothetical protein A2Z79_12485 [Deltaproteobacteria bacterium GWA2_55_82]OGQ63986.1 MAG: hypothetical protein A3I81_08015 [Deltaproteobacteria bacterium RIFCSPLOWO2_02_FULL_55_12]OIJ73419.1 MAG: hypothetical protein A2V21_303555 [Deltaproteobacteria bacterium GWC2_55_46]HAO92940.1 hypothetical protein [Deltaproteobacteria bacterium]HBG47282.1 hypothetical protein [Deltaproteobacteria bacterium]
MLKTSIDKGMIKRSFSRAASTYDEFSSFQKETAEEVSRRLASLVENGEAPSVLDIGCGTGRLMGLINASIPGARVFACDIAFPMLLKTRENNGPSCSGLVASECESLPFIDSSFDIAASSLTFQWAELSAAFSEAARVLEKSGLFIFSTLGPETLKEIRECYPGYHGLEFNNCDEIENGLKAAGLDPLFIEKRIVRKRYANLMELLRTLKYIGASPPLECGKGLSPGRALKEAGRSYARMFASADGGVYATYELMIAAARKP